MQWLRENFPEVAKKIEREQAVASIRRVRKEDYEQYPLRRADAGETAWTFILPGLPPSFNEFSGRHWASLRRIKAKYRKNLGAAAVADRIPYAEGKRRVDIQLTLSKGRKPPDHDNVMKVLADGLVGVGLLIDDGPDWLAWGDYSIRRGSPIETAIGLRNLD